MSELKRSIGRASQNLELLCRCILTVNAKPDDDIFTTMQTASTSLGVYDNDPDVFLRFYKRFLAMDRPALLAYASDVLMMTSLTYGSQLMQLADVEGKVLIDAQNARVDAMDEIIRSNPSAQFTIMDDNAMRCIVYEYLLDAENCTVQCQNIEQLTTDERYDDILWSNAFSFFTRHGKAKASLPFQRTLDNFFPHLTANGSLLTVIPSNYFQLRATEEPKAKMAQQTRIAECSLIASNGRKMVFWKFSNQPCDTVLVQQITVSGEQITSETVSCDAFDWDIEGFWAAKTTPSEARYPRQALSEVADVFRGKTITGGYDENGNIAVLNIADVTENGILYGQLRRVQENTRTIASYLLQTGDVVITARGTLCKTSVFTEQDVPVIATSNLLVIRPSDAMNGLYIKLFLDSPYGQKLVQSLQKGTNLLNLSAPDLRKLLISVPPIDVQNHLAESYQQAQEQYLQTVQQAAQQFAEQKAQIEADLI